MSDESGGLQFERAEFTGQAPTNGQCSVCQRPFEESYYTANSKLVCLSCQQQLARWLQSPPGSAPGRALKAFGLGLGGGLLGSLAWYVVEHLFNLHVGLIAILVGWLVAWGVRRGSGGRGGRGYQVLAVLLTFCCICFAFVPDVAQALNSPSSGAQGLPLWASILFALPLSLTVPFAGGFSPLTFLIAGFGLLEAWRRNRGMEMAFGGPFALAQPAAAVAPAPDQPSADAEQPPEASTS